MRRSLLPLNALRVFDAAARTLSFTRAADELAVTPAAVGQQIRALEETLGVVLFRRTAKGLELTPEAASAIPALRTGFLAFEETVEALRAGQAATRINLAAARGAVRHWLLPRLGGWLAANPDSTVQLMVLDAPVDFAQANYDLALSYGPAPDAEGVHGKPVGEEWLVTVATPDAPKRAIGWQVASDAALKVADAGLALDFALQGWGEAQVPLTLAAASLDQGLLVERGERVPSAESYWLCAPAPQWKSAKVRGLVDVLLG